MHYYLIAIIIIILFMFNSNVLKWKTNDLIKYIMYISWYYELMQSMSHTLMKGNKTNLIKSPGPYVFA